MCKCCVKFSQHGLHTVFLFFLPQQMLCLGKFFAEIKINRYCAKKCAWFLFRKDSFKLRQWVPVIVVWEYSGSPWSLSRHFLLSSLLYGDMNRLLKIELKEITQGNTVCNRLNIREPIRLNSLVMLSTTFYF